MSRFRALLLGLALVGSVVLGFFGPAKEPHHIWDYKGFFALYGFVGCALIVFASKALGKHILQRGEDYYGPAGAPPGEAPEADEARAGGEREERDRG